MKDLFGKALLDYHNGDYTEDIITTTNISDDDVLPLPYLFRKLEEMPMLEQTALTACRGKILDVGCGAGSHSLWLQEKGFHVTAIDASEGAITVSKSRGVQETQHTKIKDLKKGTFDTILLLMNGTGIFESTATTPSYLAHLKTLLAENGQLLIDSSDLQYMYDRNDDGSIWVPADSYYGELTFTMRYKNETTEAFPWLYLDKALFQELAQAAGFTFEIVAEGDNYDYLARLSVVNDSPQHQAFQ